MKEEGKGNVQGNSQEEVQCNEREKGKEERKGNERLGSSQIL